MYVSVKKASTALDLSINGYHLDSRSRQLAVLFSTGEQKAILEYLKTHEMNELPPFAEMLLKRAIDNDRHTRNAVRILHYDILAGYLCSRYVKIGISYIYDIYVYIKSNRVWYVSYKYELTKQAKKEMGR